MKKIKRNIIIFGIILTFLTTSTVLANSQSNIGSDEIREKIYDIYLNDEEFKLELENSEETAIDMLERVINNQILREEQSSRGDIFSPFASNGQYAWVVADLVMQKNFNYCGPASILMACSGMNVYVEGYDSNSKQDTIASKLERHPDEWGSSYVYDVKNVLNLYTKTSIPYYKYSYIRGTSISQNQFIRICFESLDAGIPPLLHARTGYFDYYRGHNTGHYVTVTGIDKSTGKMRIHDSNIDNNYHGIHRVNIYEAFDSISVERDRYLISGCI